MPAVRVRFAPSPTGLLHVGGLRTALYNYLFARHHGGSFVLRIEDTDRERFVAEAEIDIVDSMRWAGLDVDEGPENGGPMAPYRQSERGERYREVAERLVAAGKAYVAFDTPDEIEAMRTRLQNDQNPAATYDATTRIRMKNALTMPADEVRKRIDAGESYVIRLKVNPGESVVFEDAVRGQVSFDTGTLDDQVLVKSDGMPTYHLANVVDDRDMEITHVIRGEEWLPSTPKHLLLYRYLGWNPPVMAHLPLILSPTGGKLSKRSADQLGIPVSVRDYRAAGYEPGAVVNFLAFLGWNPGTEQELFSLDELVEAFTVDRVGSSGVQFNMDKLKWYNAQYLRMSTPEALADRVFPLLEEVGFTADAAYVRDVAALMQERITFASDVVTEGSYFFEDPTAYEEKGLQKRWKDDSAPLLRMYADRLESLEVFDEATTENALRELAHEHEAGAGRIIHPTRLAVSGVSAGPSLFHMMVVLGREVCVRRMRTAAERLG